MACVRCGTHVGAHGATAFCQVRPREKAEEIRDAIGAQRFVLSPPNQLADDIREQARAAEVFDQHAEAAIKDAMTLFETYVPRLPTSLDRRFVARIRRRSPTAPTGRLRGP